jgi:peptidoglycan pentaglycine glycine transferase (the first glycine)
MHPNKKVVFAAVSFDRVRRLVVQVTDITAGRREEWNAFVAQELSFALLQSWEWGEFKEKLGWKAFRIAVEQQGRIVAGAQMLIKPAPLGLASVAYIPRGPVGDWLDETVAPKLLSELHQVARQHKAIFLKIEPPLLHDPAICHVLQQYNFRASPYANQPQATIMVDLGPDVDDILQQMHRKTRYSVRYGAKHGVTTRIGDQVDLPAFHALMQMTGQRGQFSPRFLEYYEGEWQTFFDRKQVALLMAYYQDQLLAVRMAFRFGSYAADIHAASSGEHLNLRANYLLVWEAIKWAKAQGCRTYDLWGIPNKVGQIISEGKDPPETERTDDLWGVYHFKRSFSRNIVCYVGTYDYVYSPMIYSLSTNRFFNTDTLDQIATRMDALRRA